MDTVLDLHIAEMTFPATLVNTDMATMGGSSQLQWSLSRVYNKSRQGSTCKVSKYANAACFLLPVSMLKVPSKQFMTTRMFGFALEVPQCSTQSVDEDYDITTASPRVTAMAATTRPKQSNCLVSLVITLSIRWTVLSVRVPPIISMLRLVTKFSFVGRMIQSVQLSSLLTGATMANSTTELSRLWSGSTVAGCQTRIWSREKYPTKIALTHAILPTVTIILMKLPDNFVRKWPRLLLCLYPWTRWWHCWNKFCADAPDKLPGSAKISCPMYADAGCLLVPMYT